MTKTRLKKFAGQVLRMDLSPRQRHDWAGHQLAKFQQSTVYEQCGKVYTEERPVNDPTVERIGSAYVMTCRWLIVSGQVIWYEYTNYFPYADPPFYFAKKHVKRSQFRFAADSNLKFPKDGARITDFVR